MANEFKVRKGLIVQGSGSTILDIQGSQGQLFSVTDSLSGSLFSVNDISGVPIMEVFSDNRVNLGTFNAEAIKVSGSFATMTGSLFGTASWADNATTATSATQTSQAVTFNNGGAGAASGTTFNGSTARTISYNTIGAVPTGRTLTINGTAYDLSANRSWNVGTVTSVAGTGGYGGLTLSGTVTSTGNITLGGTPTGTWPISVSGNASTSTSASYAATSSWAINAIDANDADRAASVLIVNDTSTNATYYPAFMTATSGHTPVRVDNTGLTYNPSTNTLTTTTFAGALSGNASTATTASYALTAGSATTATNATNATNIGVTDAGADTTTWVLLAGSQTGTQGAESDAGLTYNASTNALTTTTFIGALSGNATTATSASFATTASYATTAGSVGSISANVTNNTNNYVLTATGGSSVNGEANLTFDGSTLNVNGTLTATVKSFIIDHPTKEGKKLQYGVLEGPEHSVYVRGKLTNNNTIILPDHWTGLVHEDTITVNLTPIGKKQDLWVETVSDTVITVGSDNEINCFYTVFAERKDIEKLVTEFDK